MDRRINPRASLFRIGSRPYKRVCIAYQSGLQCTRGDECPRRHEMPRNPYAHLQPPEDQNVKTFSITEINSSVLEQHQDIWNDIRNHFCTYGEIESLRFSASRTCGLLTYTTRQSAEKAMLELSGWVHINGQRLRLLWVHDIGGVLLPQKQRVDPQRNDADISTQEVGDSSSSENHRVSAFSSSPH